MPDFHQFGKHSHILTGKFCYHVPVGFGKLLSLLTVGRDACILKLYCFVLEFEESLHERPSAFFIKAAADMIKGLVIKVFDQPVKIIFHLQIYNNVRIFFEIDSLHLKDLFPQGFQFFQRLGEIFDFLADGVCLCCKDTGHFSRSVEGRKSVLNIVQGESQMLER